MRIQLLGPLRVWRGGEEIDIGPGGRRAVLGLLALACGRPLPRDDLVDALWNDRPPASATNIIQTHVKRLRRLLEPDRPPRAPSRTLPSVGRGYALHVPADGLDLLRFRQLVAAGTAAQVAGDLAAAGALLAEALALWRDEPLADIPLLAGHPKVVPLVGERLSALARYGDVMIAAGRPADALPALEEAAGVQPLDEAAQARLIRAYGAAGRRGEAFAAYHAVRRRLADDLGLDPGAELAAAHESLLRDGAAPAATPAAATPPAGGGAARRPAHAAARRPAPAQLPADVRGFTGRQAELAALDAILATAAASTAVPVAAVSGTAGVGKTALAVHWAHRVANWFPDGQLHVDLRGYDADQPLAAGQALLMFLQALGTAGPDIPYEVDARAAHYRSLLADRRMLIVLDNARDCDHVRPLLPGTAGCAVVVTSRDSLSGLVVRHGAHRLDIDLLPADDAVDLLRALIGQRVDAEPAAAEAVAARCSRLPLALRLAAEIANTRPAMALADLAAELRDEAIRLERLDVTGDDRSSVRTVFSWSYRHLPPEAARLFDLLGLHPGRHVDVYAAAALAGSDLPDARRAATALERANLVEPAGEARWRMHDLLRGYAAERAAAREGNSEALARLLDHYRATAAAAADTLYPSERHVRPRAAAAGPVRDLTDPAAARAWLDTERDNLTAAVAHAATHDRPGHAVDLGAILWRYLDSGGHHGDALTVHGHAARAAGQLGDRASQATALRYLASAHWRWGRHERAAECLREALLHSREAGDRRCELRALANLGNVSDDLGQYAEARDCYRQAMTIAVQIDDRAAAANIMDNLGLLYQRWGRYDQAHDHHQQALTLARAIGDQVTETHALDNLGLVYHRWGRYDQAHDHHQQALTLACAIGDRVAQTYALGNLGAVHLARACHTEALDHHLRALAVARATGYPAAEAQALNGIGTVYCRWGRYDEASDHHEQALDLSRRHRDSLGEAVALTGLGDVARGRGRYGHAREHLLRAMAVARGCGDHDTEMGALTSLGATLHAAGDHGAALEAYLTALARTGESGNRHQQARAHSGIADLYHATGDAERADQHRSQARTTRQLVAPRLPSDPHPALDPAD